MLFYIALTLAGIIAAAVVIWAFRSLSMAGRSAYRSLTPNTRSMSNARLAHLNTNVGSTPAPWGWGGKRTTSVGKLFERQLPSRPGNRDVARPANLGRQGSSRGLAAVGNILTGYDMQRTRVTDTSSWPYRDTLTETGQPSAKRKKGAAQRRGNQAPTKPWGW